MQEFDIAILFKGGLRNPENLEEIFKKLHTYYPPALVLSRAYGVRAAYFFARDIQMRDGRMWGTALYWNGRGFSTDFVPVPTLIDNAFLLRKEGEERSEGERWARQQQYLNGKTLGKYSLSLALLGTGLEDCAIPTAQFYRYETALGVLRQWEHCVVKPRGGRKGHGVLYLQLRDGTPYYISPTGEGVFTEAAWEAHLVCWPKYTQFLIQPQLDFHGTDGNATDFRLLISKGQNGQWQTVDIYARVGTQSVVSNVSGGGGIADARDCLNANYGSEGPRLYEKLQQLARQLPAVIEQKSDEPCSLLGIDVGIDRKSLQPYVIEANVLPGTRFHGWQLAHARVQYYRYLVDHAITR